MQRPVGICASYATTSSIHSNSAHLSLFGIPYSFLKSFTDPPKLHKVNGMHGRTVQIFINIMIFAETTTIFPPSVQKEGGTACSPKHYQSTAIRTKVATPLTATERNFKLQTNAAQVVQVISIIKKGQLFRNSAFNLSHHSLTCVCKHACQQLKK